MKLIFNDHNIIFHLLLGDRIYVKGEVPGDFEIKILFQSREEMFRHFKVKDIDDIKLDHLVNSTQSIMTENNQ